MFKENSDFSSSEISPTRCNNCVFILRNGFTIHVSCDNITHHQEYICCIWPAEAGSTTQNKAVITNNSTTIGLFTTDTSNKNYNLSEPAYLWPYTAYVLLMMGEIVARNM